MAGERIKIAELDFDVNALLASAAQAKTQILALREAQKQLRAQGKEGTAEFARNDAAIRNLSSNYNTLTRIVQNQSAATGELTTREQALTKALNAENVTLQDVQANNRELIAIRNTLNLTTEEGREQLRQINNQLDENTEFIRQNSSAAEQQRMAIGGYRDQILEATAAMSPFNGGLSGFIARAQQAGGVGPLLTGSLKGIMTGIQGVTKASLQFIMTPIGAIITAIVVAATLLYNIFKNFKPLMDKVEQAVAAVGAVFNVLKNVVIALFNPAKSLGSIFSNLGGNMRDAAKAAAELKKAQQDLEDAMASQEVATAKNRAEINKLNIQAKDRTKTEEERLALLQKAEKLENDDYKARKKNGDEALRQAYEQIRIEAELTDEEFKQLKKRGLNYKEFVEEKTGDVDEEFNTLKEALIAQAQLDDEYNANLEKNINKQNKLIEDREAKEAKALEDAEKAREDAEIKREQYEQKRRKALDDYAQKLDLQLQIFRQVNEAEVDTLNEKLTYSEQIRDKQLEIAKAEYNASEKTSNDKLQLQIRENEIRKQFIDEQVAAVVAAAQKEYDAVLAANKSKLDSNKILTDEMVAQEQQRLDKIAEAAKLNLETQLKNKVLSEEQYKAEVARIDEENRANDEALAKQRLDAENERRLTDLENKRAASQLTFEEDLAIQAERLEIERQQELAAAAKTGADIALINAKYDKQQQDLDKARIDNKLNMEKGLLSDLATIFGRQSKAGKAFAAAAALVDTYQAINKALAASPPPFNYVAAAAVGATGLRNVQKITSSKDPQFEQGGIMEIGGQRHSTGGTLFTGSDGTRFEAEQGELIGVMNRNAARHFMAFNNAFPARGGGVPNYFASGGIVNRNPAQQTIDVDDFAAKLAQANASLPQPVVAVKDVITEGNKYVMVQDNASF